MKAAASRIGIVDGRRGRFYASDDIFEEPISGDAKLVYLYLCRRADKAGVCYPARETIAEAVNKSVRQVAKCLVELRERGLLTIASNAGANGVNVYTIYDPLGTTCTPPPTQVGTTCLSTRDERHHVPTGVGTTCPQKDSHTEGSKKKEGTTHNGIVLSDDAFLASLRKNPAYEGIDIDRELGKLDAWLLTPRGRGKQKTRQRIVNWLNRADRVVGAHTNGHPLAKDETPWFGPNLS